MRACGNRLVLDMSPEPNGFNAILRPLCGVDQAFATSDTSDLFAILQSDENLAAVSEQRAIAFQGSVGRIVSQISTLPYRDFENLFELNDFYISEGRERVEDMLSSFGGYLSDDEIIAISTLLSDPFLNSDYVLSGLTTTYFAQGLDDERRTGQESRWLKVGTYWFPGGEREPVLEFLEAAQIAVESVLAKSPDTVLFHPCQR